MCLVLQIRLLVLNACRNLLHHQHLLRQLLLQPTTSNADPHLQHLEEEEDSSTVGSEVPSEIF